MSPIKTRYLRTDHSSPGASVVIEFENSGGRYLIEFSADDAARMAVDVAEQARIAKSMQTPSS